MNLGLHHVCSMRIRKTPVHDDMGVLFVGRMSIETSNGEELELTLFFDDEEAMDQAFKELNNEHL